MAPVRCCLRVCAVVALTVGLGACGVDDRQGRMDAGRADGKLDSGAGHERKDTGAHDDHTKDSGPEHDAAEPAGKKPLDAGDGHDDSGTSHDSGGDGPRDTGVGAEDAAAHAGDGVLSCELSCFADEDAGDETCGTMWLGMTRTVGLPVPSRPSFFRLMRGPLDATDTVSCDALTLEACGSVTGCTVWSTGALTVAGRAKAFELASSLVGVPLQAYYDAGWFDLPELALKIARGGNVSSHWYAPDVPFVVDATPAELVALEAYASEVYEALGTCTATKYVTPDPGCTAHPLCAVSEYGVSDEVCLPSATDYGFDFARDE